MIRIAVNVKVNCVNVKVKGQIGNLGRRLNVLPPQLVTIIQREQYSGTFALFKTAHNQWKAEVEKVKRCSVQTVKFELGSPIPR